MKKLVALTLALCMVSHMAVFAEDIQEFLTDGAIHMELSDAQGGEEIMIMVMPEEKDWEDTDAWRTGLFPAGQTPIQCDTVTADENGAYSIDFSLTDMGLYNVYAGEKKMVIRYTNLTANRTAIGMLTSAQTAEEVYALLNNPTRALELSLNSEVFQAVKNDTKLVENKTALEYVSAIVYDTVCNQPAETEFSCEQIQKVVDKACLIVMLNGNSDTAVASIDDYLEVAGFEDLDLLKYYKQEKASYVTAYLKANTISGISDFDQKLFEGLLYTNIQYNDNVSLVMTMLTDHAQRIGITDTAKITDSMVRTMVGKSFTSLQQVANHVNTYTVSTPSSAGGGGGGGGFGGGGFGGGGGGVTNRVPDSTGIGSVQTPGLESNPAMNGDMFEDLDSVPWAKEAINNLALKGIIAGRTATAYEPDATITREEFVKLIVTSLSLSVSGDTMQFEDVKESDWFYPYVRSAFNAEIINGVSQTRFGAGEAITRQDMAVIVNRALYIAGVDMEDVNQAITFADDGQVSDYAKEAVTSLQKKGIMVGNEQNCFMPLEEATRAEAAKIIYAIYQSIA